MTGRQDIKLNVGVQTTVSDIVRGQRRRRQVGQSLLDPTGLKLRAFCTGCQNLISPGLLFRHPDQVKQHVVFFRKKETWNCRDVYKKEICVSFYHLPFINLHLCLL